MLSVILKNRFLAGLVVAVLLGFVWPAPGAPGGALHAEVATRWAVVVI
ncbi:MAG: bile acid:sodium symporter, partial [Verrucomicrobia bacterium]